MRTNTISDMGKIQQEDGYDEREKARERERERERVERDTVVKCLPPEFMYI